MKHFLLLSTALLSLGACATILDDQTQDITIRTPGEENAKCFIQNEDMKYTAWTDQKIKIMKSPHDLVVHCQAGSNRDQTVHVKREVNEWVVYNVANGFVPGATYDYFSHGGFDYPEEVIVNFNGVKTKPYPLPSYVVDKFNKRETIRPGTIITEDNKDYQPHKLKKLETPFVSDFESNSSETSTSENLHRQYNATAYDPTEEDK